MSETLLDRRALSVRDILLLVGVAAGLIGIYAKMDSRLAVVETKIDLMQKQVEKSARVAVVP